MDNLNAFSKLIPELVNSNDRIIKDKIKIKTDIKYLFISLISNFVPENSNLFINIFKGLAWEANSFIENLNKE
tara:strand:+ start:187 stop:405 length:219 start_codon:yes stop_codon:yes gene_type:complete